MTAPDSWGQQQRRLVIVGLFLLDLLGTWLLVYLALDVPGSWCNWLLAYLVLSAPGFWRTWLLAYLVPGGDDVMSISVRACLRVGARRGRTLAAETR